MSPPTLLGDEPEASITACTKKIIIIEPEWLRVMIVMMMMMIIKIIIMIIKITIMFFLRDATCTKRESVPEEHVRPASLQTGVAEGTC